MSLVKQVRTPHAGRLPEWLLTGSAQGPFITQWQVSKLMPQPAGGVAAARHLSLRSRAAGWKPFSADGGFVNVHPLFVDRDGLVYLAHRLDVPRAGAWHLALGHDGGARLFVDGACVLTEPATVNPAMPGRSHVDLRLTRGPHELVVVFNLDHGRGWGIHLQAVAAAERVAPTVISDLSGCRPRRAISEKRARGHWKLVPYETRGIAGRSLQALTYTGAPEVVLPLNARGWHAVYLGLGNGGGDDDAGRNVIRVKLTGDAAYQHRGVKGAGTNEEVLFTCADLTGKSLHIAQQSSGYPRAACLYYVKLVPLRPAEIQAVKRDLRQHATKRLVGTIDGFSFLYERMATTKAELLEEFEPFRNTDFGTLWWGFTGADQINYRSQIGTIVGAHTDDCPRAGDGYFTRAVQALIRKGIDITKIAVDACHDMGIEIHISLRPAAWQSPAPYEDYFTSDFYDAHAEWRCRDRDGTPAPRLSFAVPEVRQHLLRVFREVLQARPDGLNILYNRGMPLILWEDAFCQRFREVYGEEARVVPEDDPRLYALRGEFMTEWMREVRHLLDDQQKRCGLRNQLKLSAMCLETEADNRMFGLDVARWVREGLLDQIGVYRASQHTSGKPIDLAWYKRITAGTGVPVYPGMVAWALPKTADVLKQAVDWYDGGADGLLFWDPSAKVTDGAMWPLVSHMGHEAEVRLRAAAAPPTATTFHVREMGLGFTSRWSAWAGF